MKSCTIYCKKDNKVIRKRKEENVPVNSNLTDAEIA